jgi:Zn finger protein HypA/HybF involved in hydrogenase expression
MFFKCLDCGSVILDPDLNTSECPLCGSVNFVVEEKQVAHATRYRLDIPASQATEDEKMTAL